MVMKDEEMGDEEKTGLILVFWIVEGGEYEKTGEVKISLLMGVYVGVR